MRQKLTQEEINKRMAEINAMPPEQLTPDEEAALKEAEAMDDGTVITIEAYKKQLEDYSGKLIVRMPRSLHKKLKEAAAVEGVSLNQYILYKLAK